MNDAKGAKIAYASTKIGYLFQWMKCGRREENVACIN